MFFKKNKNENNDLSKVAALLIHAAKIDENFSKSEEAIIKQALLQIGANNENLESLISKVTSKGGTTEEAINYFKKDKIFSKIFQTAILKAEEKSKYLSNN